MRWAGFVERMVERRGVYSVFVGKPEGKNHLGGPDVGVGIILRWILKTLGVRVWTGSSWIRIETGGGYL